MIDTHAHLLKKYYKEELDERISNSLLELEKIINIAFDLNSSKEVVELSNKYNNLYNVIGVHPNDVKNFSSIEDYEELINDKTVAIGEIGLDYHYDGYDKDLQKEVFEKFIDLAKRNNLPVVVHSREANEDTIEIIKKYPEVKFLFHSWSGTPKQTKELNEMGNIWFSFNGIITFKNAENIRESLMVARKDRIFAETDAPYLTPVPFRGKTNYPEYVKFVYEELNKLISISEKNIDDNVKEFFNV